VDLSGQKIVGIFVKYKNGWIFGIKNHAQIFVLWKSKKRSDFL